MKIKIKRYLEVTYSFRKLFSQSFEVLIQRGDVINPKLAQKGPKRMPHALMMI